MELLEERAKGRKKISGIRVDQDPTMEKRRYRWWMLERKRTKRKKEK